MGRLMQSLRVDPPQSDFSRTARREGPDDDCGQARLVLAKYRRPGLSRSGLHIHDYLLGGDAGWTANQNPSAYEGGVSSQYKATLVCVRKSEHAHRRPWHEVIAPANVIAHLHMTVHHPENA